MGNTHTRDNSRDHLEHKGRAIANLDGTSSKKIFNQTPPPSTTAAVVFVTKTSTAEPLSVNTNQITTITSQSNTQQKSIDCLDQSKSSKSLVNLTISGCSSLSTSFRYRAPRRSLREKSKKNIETDSKTTWPTPYIEAIFLPQFPIITSADLQDKIIVGGRPLAAGAFGIVYKARDAVDSKLFALKVLKKSQIINDNEVKQLKDEVDIQTICGHQTFIVQCLSYWQSHRKIYLLSEFAGRGELFNAITKFSKDLVQLYIAEIALAIDFLHNAGVIYRDVKPENLLLDDLWHIKLTDFGLSKWLKIGERTSTICGTPQYMVFELTMEGRQVDEAMASIFHTVLFHRSVGKFMYTGDATYSVGTVGHMDVDCDFIDFTYVCCTSPSLERNLKREISSFSEQLRSTESSGTGQISLEFFQKKRNRWPFQPECIPWEVWTVRLELINFYNEDERQSHREKVGERLTDKILYITEVMNRHDYVPKMPSKTELDMIFDTTYPDVQPYLFKFKFSTATPSGTSVGNTMKKLFKETLAL